MTKVEVHEMTHGVVIPCGDENRIPAAAAWAREEGIRGMHYGWPGMTRTQAGDLLVGASQRLIHVDPFGRVVVVRSTDDGHTWSAPEVVFDSLTDDRDVALNTLPDSTVVASWFSSSAWAKGNVRPAWQPMLDRLTPDTLRALAGYHGTRGWLRRSTDGGRTWDQRVYPMLVGPHAGPTPLANGDLIYCGPYRDDVRDKVISAATLSTDGGRTWQIIGEVPGGFAADPETGAMRTNLNENHVIETAPGRLLGAFRVYDEPRTIHMSHSADGGRTWTPARDLGVYGFPPYLLRLHSGVILCVCADRREPRTVRALFSYDDGVTWDTDNIHTLRQFEFMADMGYPVAVEMSPGEVLCVYYAVPKHREPGYDQLDMNQWGILSTRLRLG